MREFVRQNVEQVKDVPTGAIVTCWVLIFWALLWIFTIIEKAMNKIWGTPPRRFLHGRLRALAMMGVLGLLLLRCGCRLRREGLLAQGAIFRRCLYLFLRGRRSDVLLVKWNCARAISAQPFRLRPREQKLPPRIELVGELEFRYGRLVIARLIAFNSFLEVRIRLR